MPLNLKATLLSAYNRATRFFGMATQTAYPEILAPGRYTPVDIFVKYILPRWYRTEARMNELFVQEVRHYKAATRFRHEYLSAKICGPDGSFVAYLIFERSGGAKVEHLAHEQPDELFTPQPSMSLINEEGDLCSDSLCTSHSLAGDNIYFPAGMYRDSSDTCCHTFSASANRLPLWELAVLANCIHEQFVEYTPLGENCYFYSNVIFRVLQKVYHFDEPADSVSGRFLRIPVGSRDTVDLDDLERKFVADKEVFKNEIRDRRDQIERELRDQTQRADAAELEMEELRRLLALRST